MNKCILLILLFFSLTVKSQIKPVYDFNGNVTYFTGDTIKLPEYVAKRVVKDLIIGDSAIAELKLTRQQLLLTEEKIALKDTIIKYYQEKEDYYVQLIQAEKSRASLWRGQYKQLQVEYKKIITKNAIFKITIGILTGTFGVLYILK
jgi:hypothetical protein